MKISGCRVFVFLSFFLLCGHIKLASSVVSFRGQSLSLSFIDAPARFAPRVNKSGICGNLYLADPVDACSNLRNNLKVSETDDLRRFVLIERGNCAFDEKVRNAQAAGFQAAIIFDNRFKSNLILMIGNSQNIRAHAVFISKENGETLGSLVQTEQGECCISDPQSDEAAWTVFVISFISLVVIVSMVAMFLLVRTHWVFNQRRCNGFPHLLSEIETILPSTMFRTPDSLRGETCSICLEDYKVGEILRVLPCHHEFHAACVDSWLTKGQLRCPICKRNVINQER